ncbi:hypothetical protein C8Q80DRAFT_1337088 [Daedaleopsis nitida]|nr:hypothetical protein C8Q80DRAFT_1337088 [Daedaleopsis nitida]
MANSRPELLSLNDDVLTCIVSHLAFRDAVSLSYTSKAAHAIPTDPALHTIVLDGSTVQVKKFRDYLLSTESRCNWLKSLTLAKAVTWEIDDSSTEPAEALVDILRRAVNLESFNCGAMEGLICASGGRVAEALTSLTHLRDLTVNEGADKLVEAVSNLSSLHLRTLVIGIGGITKTSLARFFSPLARFPHLETLSLSGLRDISRLPETSVVIPTVHTLSLKLSDLPMYVMVAIFPNVRRLTFRSDPGYRYSNGFHIARITNPVPPSSSQCWPHPLVEVHINVSDLDRWPLTCRVGWLDFDLLLSGHSREALLAVDRTKPRVLSCAYRIDADNLFWVRLPTIATELRFLDARILELSGHRKRYMLLHVTRFPELAVVFLCIRAYYLPEDVDAELEGIAHDIAASNPKLRVIGISLTDGRRVREDQPVWTEEALASEWWIVKRGKASLERGTELGGLRLQHLPTAVGLKVRESMYRSDYDTPGWEDSVLEASLSGC